MKVFLFFEMIVANHNNHGQLRQKNPAALDGSPELSMYVAEII
jgi:hypothetical protein